MANWPTAPSQSHSTYTVVPSIIYSSGSTTAEAEGTLLVTFFLPSKEFESSYHTTEKSDAVTAIMYNNNNGYQQQGGYQQDSRQGLANEYYSEGQDQRQNQYGNNPQSYNQPPPQYQHQNSSYGDQQHNDYNQQDNRDPSYGAPSDQESSRGFLGAAAGALAGGYGAYKLSGPATGHKKTSGLVGALGGALAGHVIQDGAEHWKDKHDEKKDEKKHGQERRDSNESHRLGGHFAGGFSNSSRDVRLDGEYNLHAQCKREDGEWQGSSLALDRVLENDEGSFQWVSGRSSGGSSVVEVQAGDTLRAIAARHNCDFHELARHNGIQNEDMIYPGQRLEVPGGARASGNFSSSARNVRLVDGGQVLEGELRRAGGDWVTSRIVLDERIGNKNGCLELV